MQDNQDDDNIEPETHILANSALNIDNIIEMDGLKIMHMNIRSLNKNLDEFLIFLNSFRRSIDIVVLSEAFI